MRKIIIHIIHYIRLKKSSGYDEVTSKILKAGTTVCSHPFSYIYSHSLQTGIFPESRKIALYKKGDKPVWKITGQYHYWRFFQSTQECYTQHLHRNNKLITQQMVLGNGCQLKILPSDYKFVSWKLLTKRMHVGGIFCDLAKAFVLCESWNFVSSNTIQWNSIYVVEDWLRCSVRKRRQKVEVTSSNSTKNFSLSAVRWNMEYTKEQF